MESIRTIARSERSNDTHLADIATKLTLNCELVDIGNYLKKQAGGTYQAKQDGLVHLRKKYKQYPQKQRHFPTCDGLIEYVKAVCPEKLPLLITLLSKVPGWWPSPPPGQSYSQHRYRPFLFRQQPQNMQASNSEQKGQMFLAIPFVYPFSQPSVPPIYPQQTGGFPPYDGGSQEPDTMPSHVPHQNTYSDHIASPPNMQNSNHAQFESFPANIPMQPSQPKDVIFWMAQAVISESKEDLQRAIECYYAAGCLAQRTNDTSNFVAWEYASKLCVKLGKQALAQSYLDHYRQLMSCNQPPYQQDGTDDLISGKKRKRSEKNHCEERESSPKKRKLNDARILQWATCQNIMQDLIRAVMDVRKQDFRFLPFECFAAELKNIDVENIKTLQTYVETLRQPMSIATLLHGFLQNNGWQGNANNSKRKLGGDGRDRNGHVGAEHRRRFR